MTELKRKWQSVSLPKVLTDIAEEMIQSGKYGYRNLPDYISELLRNDLRRKGYVKG